MTADSAQFHKGGFPRSRNFYVRQRVNAKVERGSTYTFTRDLLYIASFLFTRVGRTKNATVEIHLSE